MPTPPVRQSRIAAGRCVYGCGDPRGSGLACDACAAGHAAREAQRRADHRRAGICVDCCRARAAHPLVRCRACADDQAARMRTTPDAGAPAGAPTLERGSRK